MAEKFQVEVTAVKFLILHFLFQQMVDCYIQSNVQGNFENFQLKKAEKFFFK
jgi:hypothetical protein